MNNTYYLVRHGESIFNFEKRHQGWKSGNHLTLQGKTQARNAAQKIVNNNIDLIVCSPLLRTKQTAKFISVATQSPVCFSQKIRDFRRSKVHEGMRVSEYSVREDYLLWKEKSFQDLNFSLPDGESRTVFAHRVMDFAQNLDQKYENKKIVIISHKDVIWQLLLHWGDITVDKEKMDNASIYQVDTRIKRITTI